MGTYSVGSAQEVDFKDYAPDLDPTTPGILLDMDGFEPTVKGFKSRPSPVTLAPALPGVQTPIGGYVALFSDSSVKVYAGSSTNLYRLDGAVWTTVGSGFTATSRWRFAQFGDDVIAVANNVDPQVAAGPASAFSILTGSAPTNATNVISVSSLVFMTASDVWYNSAVGTDNNWTPNIQTLAATGQFTDFPGPVVALAPLFRNVIVFKEGSMLLGQLIGGESVWNFQLLSDETGTLCQEAVVLLPESVAFIGQDDFYVTNGNTPQRIPNNLKEWFFETADPNELSNMLSWYNHHTSVIYWHFVSTTPVVAHQPDLWVAFNVRAGRWAKGRITTYFVIPVTVGHHPNFHGGLFFDVNKVLKTWTGTPGEAFLKTGYVGDPGRLSQVFRLRPKYNEYPTGSPLPDLVIPFHTNILGQPPTQDTAAVRGSDGWHYLRCYDRYHQAQITTKGDAEIVGAAVEMRPGGVR